MSEHPSLKDIRIPIETGSFVADWELSEKNFAEDSAVFDGKIIARMPDLGSSNFVKGINPSKKIAFGQTLYKTAVTLFQKNKILNAGKIFFPRGNRRQFFHYVAVFGIAVFLCGIGILFFDKTPKDVPEVVQTATEPKEESEKPAAHASMNPALLDSFEPVIPPPELTAVPPMSAVPSVQETGLISSPTPAATSANSPWDRPAANFYSPWDAAHQPAANPNADVPNPPSAINGQAATVAMAPMTPLVQSVSPYEQQPMDQQTPPARPPVETYAGQYNPKIQGMMPMHERLENVMNHPPQNTQPPYHVQAGNARTGSYAQQSAGQHGQYGQYSPYANQPAYPPQSNTPIPAGRSTLPPQGYYPVPAQNPPNSFYGTAPPTTYRRVY
jgi:hypothetical protein